MKINIVGPWILHLNLRDQVFQLVAATNLHLIESDTSRLAGCLY